MNYKELKSDKDLDFGVLLAGINGTITYQLTRLDVEHPIDDYQICPNRNKGLFLVYNTALVYVHYTKNKYKVIVYQTKTNLNEHKSTLNILQEIEQLQNDGLGDEFVFISVPYNDACWLCTYVFDYKNANNEITKNYLLTLLKVCTVRYEL